MGETPERGQVLGTQQKDPKEPVAMTGRIRDRIASRLKRGPVEPASRGAKARAAFGRLATHSRTAARNLGAKVRERKRRR